MQPREIVISFDVYLAERGLRFEAIVIGGSALNLLGVISRPTKDCDILHPAIPPEIAGAAVAFARDLRDKTGAFLQDDWLNNGPASLVPALQTGWESRLQEVFSGSAIKFHTLGRNELIAAKLFALCDRGIDLADCLALAPTAHELQALEPWLALQDANPEWPEHVRATLADLAQRLRHGL
jgi:hypothetical protein